MVSSEAFRLPYTELLADAIMCAHHRYIRIYSIPLISLLLSLILSCSGKHDEASSQPIADTLSVGGDLITVDDSQPEPGATVKQVSVDVLVKLKPGLEADPQLVVFIFVKAPKTTKGLNYPLAVTRVQVKDLPHKLRLDGSESMGAGSKLSAFSEFIVTARVSKSGNVIARPGDLQGSVKIKAGETTLLMINETI